MALKAEEQFIDKLKREHQGAWLKSPKADPFLTEFSKSWSIDSVASFRLISFLLYSITICTNRY